MPRFVVLTHDHPFPHWDFMLEEGDHLRTWRILVSPASSGTVAAELLGDHRLHYLEYEGPVSRDRGHVKRWDAGQFTIQEWTDKRVALRLEGRILNGLVVLQADDASNQWTFRIDPD